MCLAYPYRIVKIKDEWTAVAEVQGVKIEVALHLLPEKVEEGDWILVHVGFAIKKLNEEEVQRNLKHWDEIFKLIDSDME